MHSTMALVLCLKVFKICSLHSCRTSIDEKTLQENMGEIVMNVNNNKRQHLYKSTQLNILYLLQYRSLDL